MPATERDSRPSRHYAAGDSGEDAFFLSQLLGVVQHPRPALRRRLQRPPVLGVLDQPQGQPVLDVALSVGEEITGTTLDGSNNTSEFGADAMVYSPMSIVKRAFQLDGTPIASGSTLPTGTPVRFLLYIDNPSGAVIDAGLQDLLDPLFAYQTGSMRVSNSLISSTVCPAAVCDEAAIFAAADTGTVVSDAVDTDVVALSGATIHAGDGTVANARLDLTADRVWAVVFTVVIQ